MSRKPTSSQVSLFGAPQPVPLDGQTTPHSGQVRVRVSRSRKLDAAKAPRTSATSGQSGFGSFASACLQSSLENRLRARLASLGSTLFSLTSVRVTPAQRQICALRALARRTSDSACTSWPSPVVNDSKGSDYAYSQGNHDKPCLKLGGAAKLALTGKVCLVCGRNTPWTDWDYCEEHIPPLTTWPTPGAKDGDKSVRTLDGAKAEAERKGWNNDLCTAALSAAHWPTPAVTNADRGGDIRRWKGEQSLAGDGATRAACATRD